DLVDQVLQNPFVVEVIEATPELALPNCFVAAGCVTQTVWNLSHRRDPTADIKDIDLVYFDPDPSESKEQADRQRVTRRFEGVPVKLDVTNEARVHVWYEGVDSVGNPSKLQYVNMWVVRRPVKDNC
ncbi:MAG: nucleotidyltransferase family protein, partial [Trueperaceae bacterium]